MQIRSLRSEHADVPATPYRRYLVIGQLVVVLASVALFGCRDISAPIAPPPETPVKPERASYDVAGCTLGTTICARIDSAITFLETDPDNIDCRGAGAQARSRFVSTSSGIGFAQGSEQPNIESYVTPMNMNTNPSDYIADGRTYLNISNLTSEGLNDVPGLAHIIAHEEYHHYGYSGYHSQWDWNWNEPGPPPPPCDLAQFHWWS